MAYTPLRTDFKDDILDSSNYKRKYKQVVNNDGTFSFQDETTYQQVGSDYGAKEVNEERAAINKIYENKLVTLDDVALVTEEGFFVDALAVKELNSKLAKANTKLDNESKNWEHIGTKIDKSRIYIDETKYKEIFCELRLYDQYLQITFPVKYINNISTSIEKSFCTGGYQTPQYPGVWAELKTGKMGGAAHPYVYFNRGFVNGNAITSNYGICIWGR